MVISPCCEDTEVEKNKNGKKQKIEQFLYYHFEEEIMKKVGGSPFLLIIVCRILILFWSKPIRRWDPFGDD